MRTPCWVTDERCFCISQQESYDPLERLEKKMFQECIFTHPWEKMFHFPLRQLNSNTEIFNDIASGSDREVQYSDLVRKT